jgi:hypothetical protein
MILDYFQDLNWLAILVATAAWFVFSAIWYSVPPLSKAWASNAKVDVTGDGPPLALLFIPTLIGYFVTSIVIGLLVKAIPADTLGAGVTLGVVLGIGFGMVGSLVNQVYESKGSAYFLINGLNSVIAYAIVGGILATWA